MIWLLLTLIGVLLFFAANREASSKVRGQLTAHALKTGSPKSIWLSDINPLWLAKIRFASYGLLVVGFPVYIGLTVDWSEPVQAIASKFVFVAVFALAGASYANWRELRSYTAVKKVDTQAR